MKLNQNLKSVCFDIDGVICSKCKNSNYKISKPIKKNIKIINKLYERGYKITLFTARYMGKYNNNRILAEKNIKKLTLSQLKKWRVNYHEIFFGKPSFDLMVDDKALFFKKEWANLLKNELL
jgi:uncharacterized HAD superfamily protein